MTFKLLLTASALGLVALVYGCSSDDKSSSSSSSSGESENGEPTSPFPSCQVILHACHPLDVGEGAIHDCHETAHDNGASEANCAAQKEHCLQVCVPDAGASSSGDAG
jgi:hypothetical protein